MDTAKSYAQQIEGQVHTAESVMARPDHHQDLRLAAADAVVKLRDEIHDIAKDPRLAAEVGKQLLKDGMSETEISVFLPGAKVETDKSGHEQIVFSPIAASAGKTTDEKIENASHRIGSSAAEGFLERLETWMPGDLHSQQLAWKHFLHVRTGTPEITKAENEEVHKHIPNS